MSGTFQAGDLLGVGRAARESVHPGDVIAFYKTESSGAVKCVAHRVKRRTAEGFVTQGDADRLPDPLPVTFENLIGRVEFVVRDGRVRPVLGGLAGQVWAAHLSLRRKIRQLGRWPYRLLKKSGLVRCFWHPRIEQIHVASAEGNWVKYLHGQRTVARWSAEEKRFWCYKPYDLVIDHPGEKQAG